MSTAALRADTRAWLDSLPVEALQCRTLRHAWPRTKRRDSERLPGAGMVTWKVLGEGDGGRLVERAMECIGGCGTIRLETFLRLRDGRMVREGKPRYRHSRPYVRKRAEPDLELEPLGQDQLLGAVVARLLPNVSW